MELNTGIIVSFFLYFVFMIGIGVYYFSKSKNLSDYILGGRSLNGWVTALSAQASDMSGWLLIGLPGAAYLSGLETAWIAIGLLIGTYLNWKFVAKKFRQYTEKTGDSLTIPDYLENRFRDSSKSLRLLSASFILFFFLIYTASGFVAGATLFKSVFGLSYTNALTIGAVLVISYTFLGGFLAVCWTDFFQGILMFFAIIIVPIMAVMSIGGVSESLNEINNIDINLLKFMIDSSGDKVTFIGIVSLLAWGLGYFGQPHILVRFMGIRNADEIKKSRLIAMVWVSISLVAALFVGIIGRVYFKEMLPNSETVFMNLVNSLFHPMVAGLLLAAILAAVMSTADSQLLVTASAISEDFYKVLFRKNASDKELLWVSRLTVVIVAIIAYLLALDPENTVMGLVSYAWAGFGATFGPVIILSLYWKRMNRQGALAGLIVGGITTIIWKLSGFPLYEIVPGFIFATVAIIVVSLISKEPNNEITDEFNSI